ncbi:hypothetical protein [Streptomyces sp. AcE210]|uniref:hypothetical protein n=1 Tax=Streptomyces sp. AcE210 TaxID=2292703 RepID=UPI001F0C97E6|nr:hypothetical protein [Streptomyces sp. AcE210]
MTAHGLTLSTCRQADLDRWFTDDSAIYRQTAGHFIRWARTNKLTTVHVPAVRWNGPTQPLDDEHRWNVARRLLHDDTLKPEDRLAGLLLLLYAQGPSAIHRLTTEDVEVGAQEMRLHLGNAPVQLPEPVAQLARTVTTNRNGHSTFGALAPSPWLFPGGQPGRPISTTQLTQRLNNLGIRPNQARSTTLPARHRDPRCAPRPRPGHPHRRRRRLATSFRRRLGHLRRRSQPAANQDRSTALTSSDEAIQTRKGCDPNDTKRLPTPQRCVNSCGMSTGSVAGVVQASRRLLAAWRISTGGVSTRPTT